MYTILYVGPCVDGSTTEDRARCLEALGHQVIRFNTKRFEHSVNRLSRSLAYRFNYGRIIFDLNQSLKLESYKYDLVWIDKGVWLEKETLNLLKKRSSRNFVVHFTPDAQFLQHSSTLFEDCIKVYDLLVTTKLFERHLYRNTGVEYMVVKQGYSRTFDLIRERPNQNRQNQLVFIGHSQRQYVKKINKIAKAGLPHEVHGPGWLRKALYYNKIRAVSNGLWGLEYVMKLCNSTIGLGLLSKYIPETSTTRSFEIPASGALLIAENSTEHQDLYAPDEEALLYSSDEEMVSQIRFAIMNPKIAQKIAYAGYLRAVRGQYGSYFQVKKIISRIQGMLGDVVT